MERIKNIQPLVYKALVDKPATRTDDFILVLEVFKNFMPAHLTFETALVMHKELGLPSFASIIRIRRKLQLKHPELVNESTAQMRETAETEYRDYALNN